MMVMGGRTGVGVRVTPPRFDLESEGRLTLATLAPAMLQAYADVTGGGRPALGSEHVCAAMRYPALRALPAQNCCYRPGLTSRLAVVDHGLEGML
jgi:hypothetical protein